MVIRHPWTPRGTLYGQQLTMFPPAGEVPRRGRWTRRRRRWGGKWAEATHISTAPPSTRPGMKYGPPSTTCLPAPDLSPWRRRRREGQWDDAKHPLWGSQSFLQIVSEFGQCGRTADLPLSTTSPSPNLGVIGRHSPSVPSGRCAYVLICPFCNSVAFRKFDFISWFERLTDRYDPTARSNLIDSSYETRVIRRMLCKVVNLSSPNQYCSSRIWYVPPWDSVSSQASIPYHTSRGGATAGINPTTHPRSIFPRLLSRKGSEHRLEQWEAIRHRQDSLITTVLTLSTGPG
jgi:hypothetical protein